MDHYQALLSHAQALQRQVDGQCRMLRHDADCSCRDELQACPHLRCPHERQLRSAVKDVIDTLEETRKSFKSTQLEKLRRRMLEVLCLPAE